MKALLIGKEPCAQLGYEYVTGEPYDALVIGSLTIGQLLRFQEERVLQALAEGILRLFALEDRAAKLGDAAGVHARQTHDPEKNLRELMKIYDEIR